MKAKVLCTNSVADQSHRGQQQEIDIAMDDRIGDVKIKVTMVYSELDPQQFTLCLNRRKLGENQKISDLVKMNGGNNQLVFTIQSSSCNCCILI